MTVLAKYERLECPGTWRPSDDAQRRNVFVSLGDATLVIKDAADMALAHWSLPAVERLNPGTVPALYSPSPDGGEELEIDDPDMIEAIATVARALARTRPRRGRLRLWVTGAMAAGIATLGALWLPGALVQHTAAVLPDSTRQEIGRRLLRELEPVTGRPCAGRDGRRALAALQARLFPDGAWEIVVVPGGPAMTASLPGGFLLLHRRMIEEVAGPEVTAGALLAEAARAEAQDPAVALMQEAGAAATFRLLTQGEIAPAALSDHAATLLTRAAPPAPAEILAARFDAARVSPDPWLEAVRGGAVSGARDADIAATAVSAADPVLADGMWVRLQGICQR